MYVPVLKWKQGEQWACKGLADDVADTVYPLFEIPPRPIDPKTKAPKKTIDGYLESIAESFSASWKGERRFAVDLTCLEESLDGVSAARAEESLFRQLRNNGYRPIAVARSDQKPSQLQTVRRAAAPGGEGVMIRCIWEDVSQGTLADMLDYLVGELDYSPSNIDLVIDLRSVSRDNIAGMESSVAEALTSIRKPRNWRSITLAGSAFPRNLAGLKPSRHVIPRLDWSLYQSLIPVQKRLERPIWYGDYGIAHWELPDIDVTMMQMSANLRYTDEDDWVVFKGTSVNTNGYGQYVDLCQLLIADDVYCGEDYSMGDANYTVTTKTGKPGNASCWRRDATNHHFTLVSRQLASLGVL